MAIIAFLSDGGIEKYLVTQRALMLGKYLVQDGHEVHLFLKEEEGDREKYGENQDGIQLHYVSAPSKIKGVFRKYSLMKEHEFEIVHCLKPSWSFLASILYKIKNPKHLLLVDHDELESRIVSIKNRLVVRALERISFYLADKTIVSSRSLAEYFKKFVAKEKLLYLQYAVEADYINDQNKRCQTWKLDGKKILTYMGIFEKRYNQSEVIDVARLLLQERQDLHFYFVGDGAMLDDLVREVKVKKLDEHITFTSFLPAEEIPNILAATDVFVFPIEDNEINKSRCPYKIFQYVSADHPIVTNKVGEVYSILGECGFYYQYGNVEDFKEKIMESISMSSNGWSYPDELRRCITWETRYRDYRNFLFGLQNKKSA